MVFVTGDCHAKFQRFSSGNFPIQKELTQDDVVLVCGDFGIWHDSPEERYWLDWLAEKPFTVAFVDGNHENFDRLYSDEFPIVDFCENQAQMIRKNVIRLLRGEIYRIEGKSFFAFGGASSHDIEDGILDRENYLSDEHFMNEVKRWNKQRRMFRINHFSWWERELPTEEELQAGLANLAAHGNKVDYIITHCAPKSIAAMLGYSEYDCLTDYFEELSRTVMFEKWFFGHYHTERIPMWGYQALYGSIERIL